MSNPVAFITGASRGIGRGIALALAREGCDIVAAATRADPANTESGVYEVKARVEELGRRCRPVAGDMAGLDDHRRMVDEALAEFGVIDILVNNAGITSPHRDDMLTCPPEAYDRLMAVNLRGPFFLTQTVARHMAEDRGAGRPQPPTIFFITSISSDTVSINRSDYCISKAGLAMAAQCYAVRLAELGINVYDVRPGIVLTDMSRRAKEKYDRLMEEGLLLQKRWGTPDDVGKAVASLARGDFEYATGEVFELSGGFSVKRL